MPYSSIKNERHLPPALRGLPTIRAEVIYTIAPGKPRGASLEGPVFDRYGNFYCCHTNMNDTRIKKITPEGEISDFYHSTSGLTVGLCFHKDGRCFAADMDGGCIRILNEQGQLLEQIPVEYEGVKLRPDCMVFHEGDLYFTDLRGTFRNPTGGVYILTAESGYHEVRKYLGDLASPDGITFAPDGSSLWITECSSNSILRYVMRNGKPGIAQHTPIQAYRNGGTSNVDTHAMDENGFIYLGVMFGGRAVVLDPEGVPVANILVPGFEENKLRFTPNLALKADKAEGYMVASDNERAVIVRFPTMAPGQKLYATE